MPLTTLPPPLVFDDDLPPVFHNDEVYHEQPGDIPVESWGILRTLTTTQETSRRNAKRMNTLNGYEKVMKPCVHMKTMKNSTEGMLMSYPKTV